MIGTTSSVANASQGFSTNMAIKMPTSERTLASSEVTFCETAWLIASISLVRRLISSPAVNAYRNNRSRATGDGRTDRGAACSAPAADTRAITQLEAAWNRLFNRYTTSMSSDNPQQARSIFAADELVDRPAHQIRSDQAQQSIDDHQTPTPG